MKRPQEKNAKIVSYNFDDVKQSITCTVFFNDVCVKCGKPTSNRSQSCGSTNEQIGEGS